MLDDVCRKCLNADIYVGRMSVCRSVNLSQILLHMENSCRRAGAVAQSALFALQASENKSLRSLVLKPRHSSMYLYYKHWKGTHRCISGACWLVRLAESVNSRPVRDPVKVKT